MEKIKFYIAKWQFSSNIEVRIALYKKIKAFMEQGIPIKAICISILKKKKEGDSKPDTIFLKHLLEVLNNAGSVSSALEGWAAPSEIMLIKAGEDSGNLPESLGLTIDLMLSLNKMKKETKKALTYPVILLLLLLGMMYGFAVKMVPTLEGFGNQDQWAASSLALVNLTTGFKENAYWIFPAFLFVVFVIVKTLPIWVGKVREKFDKFPPWSLYREVQSGIFLISSATLMQSGMPLRKSLRNIKEDSNNYVKYNIDIMIKNMGDGMSNGEAINIPFLGEIGDDIEIYGEVADFEKSMFAIGKDSIDQKIEKIQKIANGVKSVFLLMVATFIIWMYGSFMQISQSITATKM